MSKRAKFQLGDRVRSRMAPQYRGEVSYIAGYDHDLGQFRYRVLEDGGRRNYWNEDDMALDQSASQRPNGRATIVDATAARELDLYIANTYELVGAPNSIGKSIDANLKRKLANGTYDPALAPRAWQYLVDQGAKRYEREFGDSSPVFNAATRRQVAEDFARAWEADSAEFQHQVALSNQIIGEVIDEERLERNARQIPEYLKPYADWSYEDFYQDALDDGRTRAQARLDATTSSAAIGRLGFLPPRNVPKGWIVHSGPIFRRRDAKPAFEAHKGTKYMVFGLDGKPLSPELFRIRGLIEWRDANGWVSGR